jgi:hypothetical protein
MRWIEMFYKISLRHHRAEDVAIFEKLLNKHGLKMRQTEYDGRHEIYEPCPKCGGHEGNCICGTDQDIILAASQI